MVRGSSYNDLLEVATALGKAIDILGKVERSVNPAVGGDGKVSNSDIMEMRETRVDLFRSTSTIDSLISQIERGDGK